MKISNAPSEADLYSAGFHCRARGLYGSDEFNVVLFYCLLLLIKHP